MKHWHHIVPRHAGGDDSPENLVLLTLEEHAEAHRQLWLQHGRWEDKLAWQGLASTIPQKDVLLTLSSRGGKKGRKTLENQRRNGSKLWTSSAMRAHISEKRREQSRIGKNPMQGKRQALVCCLCCTKIFSVNNLARHNKGGGFSVAKKTAKLRSD